MPDTNRPDGFKSGKDFNDRCMKGGFTSGALFFYTEISLCWPNHGTSEIDMSYAVISEPFETDDGSYVMLVGTCDGVTTKSFANLEEAAKELQTVKNMIAMNAGGVAMVLVSDAGDTVVRRGVSERLLVESPEHGNCYISVDAPGPATKGASRLSGCVRSVAKLHHVVHQD